MKEDFIFQVLEWHSTNEELDEVNTNHVFKIYIFGKNSNAQSVCAIVSGFEPFFYVKIPDKWKKTDVILFIDIITKNMKKNIKKSLSNWTIEKKKDFYGFKADKEEKFIKFSFINLYGFFSFSKIFDNEIEFKNRSVKYQKYESDINSILKVMYFRDLQSCGWIKIPEGCYEYSENLKTRCDIEIKTSIQNLENYENMTIAKFKVLAFDLECWSESGEFPVATNQNDKIITIGNTFNYYGEYNCYKKVVFTLDSCNKIKSIDGVEIEIRAFEDERDMLIAWAQFIVDEDPDIITGYNIFGFDEPYLEKRSKLLECYSEFSQLSRIIDEECILKEVKLSSSAIGDTEMYFFAMTGRVQIDLMKYIQRNEKLDSYKLDSVVSQFIREKVIDISNKIIQTKNTDGLMPESFISFTLDDKISKTKKGKKYKVVEVKKDSFTLNEIDDEVIEALKQKKGILYWAEAKDDLSPNEMFKYFTKSSKKRSIIAKYCLKDCELCNKLITKLSVISNNIGMANVCSVPLSYIFYRGQNIKSFSLISRVCYKKNYCVPACIKDSNTDNTSYEGATVFEPDTGIYFVPIGVADYSSLYPSCIIEFNGSPETLVCDEEYDNLPDYSYYEITYKNNEGTIEKCRFAKKKTDDPKNNVGVIPEILLFLIKERKRIRKLAEEEKDNFKQKILDGYQLALKISSNSIYGFFGANQFNCKKIAACTTAVGRIRLETAKMKVESEEFRKFAYENFFNFKDFDKKKDIDTLKILDNITQNNLFHKNKYLFKGEVIYGDTDSIFINFNILDSKEQHINNEYSLAVTIRLSMLACEFINKTAPFPQCISYEKTLWPYVIVAKKKYFGNLYEKNISNYYLKCMGIVLKRRDNAPIVKEIFGSVIDTLIKQKNIESMLNVIKKMIIDVLSGNYSLDKFIITKTLKKNYKNPKSIAHKVLADRIAKREPGNAPQVNDRIPFVYIINKKAMKEKKILQGDLNETPTFITENKLPINYNFYVTNQIMNPLLQILELVMFNPKTFFDDLLEKERMKQIGMNTLLNHIKIIDKKNKVETIYNMSKMIYKFKDSGNSKPIDTSHIFSFSEKLLKEEDINENSDEKVESDEMPNIVDKSSLRIKKGTKIKKTTINKNKVHKFITNPGKMQCYDYSDDSDYDYF